MTDWGCHLRMAAPSRLGRGSRRERATNRPDHATKLARTRALMISVVEIVSLPGTSRWWAVSRCPIRIGRGHQGSRSRDRDQQPFGLSRACAAGPGYGGEGAESSCSTNST
jgi:hypothetical protein